MASERYVRPTVAGWLTPTLIAPWVTAYGATLTLAFLHFDNLFGKALGIVAGLIVASVWAFVYCAMLVIADLLLLGVRIRTLPAGKKGWAVSLLSPLAVFGAYVASPPYKYYAGGPWAVAAAVLIPMGVVAIASRVIGGTKPPR